MTVDEYIKSIVETKGWLAIENLYYDDGSSVTRVPNTHGRIAIDKTNNMLYVITMMDSLTTSSMTDRLVIFDDRDLSVLNMITVYDLSRLQRFALSAFIKSSYYKKPGNLPIPTIPKTIVPDNLITHDIVHTCSMNEHEDIPLIKIYNDHKIYLNVNEVNRFYTNQDKFKQFISTYLEVPLVNLI